MLVEDEKRREKSFIQLARRWRAQDPAAAEAWLQQSPLSEAARAKAREKPGGTKRQQRRGRQQRPPSPESPEAPGDPQGR
jgi:hypothetical protein